MFPTKQFRCGDFILEYKGNLIRNFGEALKLGKEYSEADKGSFMYKFFKYRNKTMW